MKTKRNKYKIGNLIKNTCMVGKHTHGIVLETGIDYPGLKMERRPYALVHWNDGRCFRLYRNYGKGYKHCQIVG